MSFLQSKKFHTGLGWFISIVLLLWVGAGLEWHALGSAMREINYFYLIPLTVIMAIHYWFKAYRWRFLLPSDKALPSTFSLFDYLMIGNMASFVLPLRAGEFIRPYLLTKDSKFKFSTTFASIVIERFFDLATVLLLLALVSPSLPTLPDWALAGVNVLSVLSVGIFAFMFVSAFLPGVILKFSEVLLKFLPTKLKDKLHDLIASLMAGASVLRDPRRLGATVIFSILIWASVWGLFWVGLMMFEGEWTYLLALTLTVIVALAVAAPSAPGFIGVFQTACVASFVLLGFSKEVAFAYSLVMHAHQFIFICGYGAYALSRRHLTLNNLKGQAPFSIEKGACP